MRRTRTEGDQVENRGLVNVETAAEILGIRVSTLYTWCEHQRVPHVRLGRALRFDLNTLSEWIDQHTVHPAIR